MSKKQKAKNISIHALREEGDSRRTGVSRNIGISIHALREEGDSPARFLYPQKEYFYPRPPRGGRLTEDVENAAYRVISIHALREEGD